MDLDRLAERLDAALSTPLPLSEAEGTVHIADEAPDLEALLEEATETEAERAALHDNGWYFAGEVMGLQEVLSFEYIGSPAGGTLAWWLLEVEDGKKAKARLKSEFEKKQKQLDSKQEAVKKMKDDLEQQAMMLSEDAKRAKAMELQRQMYELQQLYLELQGDLSKKEGEATKKIFDRMGKIIEEIGKEKDFEMILEKTESSVLYAKSGLEITNEVIKRYNASK